MRQLAAREGRDALVGEAIRPGQPHVERPLLLLAPAGLGEPALRLERFPPLRREPVEVGMMAAVPRRQRKQAGPAGAAGERIEHHWAPSFWLTLPLASIGRLNRSTGTGVSRVRSRS